MNKAHSVDLTKTYNSNNSGKFKIIEDIGMINHVHYLNIQFIETGYIKRVRYTDAMKGEVKDPNNYMAINITDKVYHSNSNGDFRIIQDLGTNQQGFRKVRIEFIDTGYQNDVFLSSALAGKVKDRIRPSVYGVGYLGNADTSNEEDKRLYKVWTGMLSRCYNKNDTDYSSYGMLGVTVDVRWHSFENFINDVKLLPGYQYKLLCPDLYHLDKDYLQYNIPKCNRIYSKDTCIWLYREDNKKLACNNVEAISVPYYNSPPTLMFKVVKF